MPLFTTVGASVSGCDFLGDVRDLDNTGAKAASLSVSVIMLCGKGAAGVRRLKADWLKNNLVKSRERRAL